jgi:hypothetical protein
MVNYTQTFDEFASSLGPTDLALYAGAAIILWIFFKDQLNPVTTFLKNSIETLVNKKSNHSPLSTLTVVSKPKNEDVFFELVASWKKTRDLAVSAGCSDAIKVADQMFPYLSPNGCKESKEVQL